MGHAVGRCAVLAITLSVLSLFESARASAQDAEPDDEAALRLQLEDAHYLRGTGMGLTLGGVITAGGGTASLFSGDVAGAISGGTFAGLGGVVGLAGIPMWIVGAIRSDVLGAAPDDRVRVAWDYELAGIVTTLTGTGIALVGLALMFVGFGLVRGTGEHTHELFIGTGGALIPIGTFIALFIGTPLWAEAARF